LTESQIRHCLDFHHLPKVKVMSHGDGQDGCNYGCHRDVKATLVMMVVEMVM
jgi:hypothetical protein